jgi:hypothetical protein
MDSRLSILTFPQRYDGASLHLRVLLVPRLSAVWNGESAAAADSEFSKRRRHDAGVRGRQPAARSARDERRRALPRECTRRFHGSAAAGQRCACQCPRVVPGVDRSRTRALSIVGGAAQTGGTVKTEIFIKKYLPRTYRDAFLFTGPRTPDAVTDDSYHCAIKEAKDPNPLFQPSPDTVNWGQIYAFCLRHSQLAIELGLIRMASVAVDALLFETGGFVYVDLAAGSDYAAQAAADFTFLKRYAARIPPLDAGTARQLFAAVQFPVLFDDPMIPGPPAAPGNFDTVFIEARITTMASRRSCTGRSRSARTCSRRMPTALHR